VGKGRGEEGKERSTHNLREKDIIAYYCLEQPVDWSHFHGSRASAFAAPSTPCNAASLRIKSVPFQMAELPGLQLASTRVQPPASGRARQRSPAAATA